MASEENKPITLKTIFIWMALFSSIAAIGWGLSSDRATVLGDVRELKTQVEQLNTKLERTDRIAGEMGSKLDRVITILERLDKKMGSP